ncbi:MAG: hypothetical protein RBR05_01410 [Candidatus Methanomethylophilaceae archaeon]|nr:hypothetical protein [Candidatus Methanomethylophilaceae archaeon]
MTLKSEEMNELQGFCNKNLQYNIILIGVILGFDVLLGLEIISSSSTNSMLNESSMGILFVLISIIIGFYSIIRYQSVSMNMYQEYLFCKSFSEEIYENSILKIVDRNKRLTCLSIYTVFTFLLAFLSFLLKDYGYLSLIISIIFILIVLYYTIKNLNKKILFKKD